MPLSQQQLLNQHESQRVKLTNGIIVYKVSPYLIDVFVEEGFNKHSRYHRVKGRWLLTAGQKLPVETLKTVIQCL